MGSRGGQFVIACGDDFSLEFLHVVLLVGVVIVRIQVVGGPERVFQGDDGTSSITLNNDDGYLQLEGATGIRGDVGGGDDVFFGVSKIFTEDFGTTPSLHITSTSAGFDSSGDQTALVSDARSTGDSVIAKLIAYYMQNTAEDTAAVTSMYGAYYAPGPKAAGSAITNHYAFYSNDMSSTTDFGTNPYYFWADAGAGANCDSGGVARINHFGIFAYYNPCFAKYAPAESNFERLIVRFGDTGVFGTDNVAYIGMEVGGTGTNRVLNLLGASIGAMSIPGTYTSVTASNFLLSGTTQTIEGAEITAPAAPAANGFKIYSQDNGSGKTQLCAIFSSGAAQCFATQP